MGTCVGACARVCVGACGRVCACVRVGAYIGGCVCVRVRVCCYYVVLLHGVSISTLSMRPSQFDNFTPLFKNSLYLF